MKRSEKFKKMALQHSAGAVVILLIGMPAVAWAGVMSELMPWLVPLTITTGVVMVAAAGWLFREASRLRKVAVDEMWWEERRDRRAKIEQEGLEWERELQRRTEEHFACQMLVKPKKERRPVQLVGGPFDGFVTEEEFGPDADDGTWVYHAGSVAAAYALAKSYQDVPKNAPHVPLTFLVEVGRMGVQTLARKEGQA